MSSQFNLGFPVEPQYTRVRFIASPCNLAALALVEDAGRWPNGMLMLQGGPGRGKTHLAHIWAEEQGAPIVDAGALTVADAPDLAEAGRVVVERVDGLARNAEAEQGLFHLFNLIKGRGQMLLTSREAPAQMGLGLPDLKSRLSSVSLVYLGEPDDELLAAVLEKLLADRQLKASGKLIVPLYQVESKSYAT